MAWHTSGKDTKEGPRRRASGATGVIEGLLLLRAAVVLLRVPNVVPSNAQVREAFEHAMQNARVLSVGVGEGNDEAADLHIDS